MELERRGLLDVDVDVAAEVEVGLERVDCDLLGTEDDGAWDCA